MIATPSSSETCEFKSKFRSSPDPDSVTKQSDQPKRVSSYDPESHADTNSESSNQNLKQIDRCLKRLADNNLSGIEHVSAYLRDQHRRGCRARFVDNISIMAYGTDNINSLNSITRMERVYFVEAEIGLNVKEIEPVTVAYGFSSVVWDALDSFNRAILLPGPTC